MHIRVMNNEYHSLIKQNLPPYRLLEEYMLALSCPEAKPYHRHQLY